MTPDPKTIGRLAKHPHPKTQSNPKWVTMRPRPQFCQAFQPTLLPSAPNVQALQLFYDSRPQ